jgi:MIP family channel proteins
LRPAARARSFGAFLTTPGMRTHVRSVVAEFIGAFGIVFMGSGALMMSARTNSQVALLAAAFSYALTVAALVASLSRISGHFNPAITVAFVVTRRTAPADGALKLLAQLAGAVAGAWFLSTTYPPDLLQPTRIGGTILAPDVTFGHGVALEAVTTAILAITVCGLTAIEARPPAAGIVVGFVVGALIMAIGPLTGASFNPARSFGPALVSGIWEAHLVYWIGPVLGAVGGTLLWDVALAKDDRVKA